jgi:putative addiction module CopG family antidote
MQITLTPEHQKFVDSQVRAGRFQSPEQVVAEALSRLMQEPEEEIDDETFAALRRSEEQLARGEGRALDDVRDEVRAKYTRR